MIIEDRSGSSRRPASAVRHKGPQYQNADISLGIQWTVFCHGVTCFRSISMQNIRVIIIPYARTQCNYLMIHILRFEHLSCHLTRYILLICPELTKAQLTISPSGIIIHIKDITLLQYTRYFVIVRHEYTAY